ncbi:MAG: glycosyltransferase family 9 protein [Pseudomonadota bacterium]
MRLPPLFVRAPNHLGDGVMALPAVAALAAASEGCRVAAPAWGEVVYRATGARWVPQESRPEREETAVLLAPSFRAAWQARRARRRVGLATDGRRLLLTDAVQPPGGHRRDDYSAVARALGVDVVGPPRFRAAEGERAAWAHLPVHVGLNPVSVSGATVEWPHFSALAAVLSEPVRVYCGPGEEARARAAASGTELLAGLPLGALAGALARCRVLVSNDSGVAHFAAACGVRTVVLFGSTSATRTGPAGCEAVEGPALDCRPCYRKRCDRDLGCLGAIGPERVLEVLG